MPLSPPRLLNALVVPAVLALSVTGCGSKKQQAVAPTTTTPGAAGVNASSDPSAVDASFVRQMDAHHELAISMATIAKHRAKNAQVQTLAANIVRVQKGELNELAAAADRLKVNIKIAKSKMQSDAQTLGIPPMSLGMSASLSTLRTAANFDKTFLNEMIPHHIGAITMAQAEVSKGKDPQLKQLAQRIIAEQNPQVALMGKLVAKS